MKRIFFVIFFLLMSINVSADTIILKSGRIIKGKIVHKTRIYVRLEPRFLGDPDREFLMENVSKIIKGESDYIPAEDVINYVSSPDLDDVPAHVQQVAKNMAASLLEQAMRSVEVGATENVQRVAEQKATDILSNAMNSLNDTPDNVKAAAKEIVNSLLEETVRTTAIASIDDVPQDVKRAAEEKATALIERAMQGTVEEAPDQVKLAAQLKARALIADAMEEINILDKVISEGQTVQHDLELSNVIQRNKLGERQRVTSFEREIEQGDVDKLMNEAVERRIRTVKENENYEIIEVSRSNPVDDFFEGEPSAVVKEQIELEASVEATEHEPLTYLTQDELQARIATIPKPKSKNLSFTNFILALSYRDYLIMGLCIVLLLILLQQRSRHKGYHGAKGEEQDIQVVSSVTFQHLPTDVKSKFTSSDISLILDLEGQYQQQMDKSDGEFMIEEDKLINFIQNEAQKIGSRFTFDDLKKVLETKEKTITDIGLA